MRITMKLILMINLFFTFAKVNTYDIFASAKPEYVVVSAGESVTLICIVPQKEYGKPIKWNHKIMEYSEDCQLFYPGFCPLCQCWCGDQVHNGTDDHCPDGTTNITIKINDVGPEFVGLWKCIYETLSYEVHLKPCSKYKEYVLDCLISVRICHFKVQ